MWKVNTRPTSASDFVCFNFLLMIIDSFFRAFTRCAEKAIKCTIWIGPKRLKILEKTCKFGFFCSIFQYLSPKCEGELKIRRTKVDLYKKGRMGLYETHKPKGNCPVAGQPWFFMHKTVIPRDGNIKFSIYMS
jgi:hypothetical protein